MVDLFGDPQPAPDMSYDNDMIDDAQSATPIEDIEDLTPRTNSKLIGHKHIEKDLIERIETNRMPHALILHGPKGIGKSTLAFRLARFLFDKTDNSGGLFDDGASDLSADSLAVDEKARAHRLVASGGRGPQDVGDETRKIRTPFPVDRGKCPFRNGPAFGP